MQRPSRFADRPGMVMDKRGRDPDLGDEQPEPKRPKVPALASVIVEALKVDSLQKLCSSLEPILRRVVSEEVERALAKLGPARVGGRTSPKQLEGPDGRNLQLHFRSRLSLPLFTGGKVEGEQGAAIHIVLMDANTGHVVTDGPESSAKLDILVLEGDFNNEDEEGWTEEEFESHIVKEREGKRPILTGDLQVSLKEGVGTLGDLTFTDNSSWIRSRKFRLGLRISPGFCEGIRVREAKTEAFTVKDHRGELYKKHYPPKLKDEVWRLEKIGKDGSFHKRLNKANINTVEEFLRLVVRDSQKLRNILGNGMSNKMWESLLEHAKTCVLSGKLHVYYPDGARNVGAIFNNIYEFTGLIAGGQYISPENLSDSQKVFADSLVKKAYDNWTHVIEYDGKVLADGKQSKRASNSGTDSIAPANYGSYDQHVSVPHLPSSTSSLSSMESSLGAGGGISSDYDAQSFRYGTQSQQVAMNSHVQLGNAPYALQNQYTGSSFQPQIARNDTGVAGHGPLQPSNFFQLPSPQLTTSNNYDDWFRPKDNHAVEDFLSEDEIRMRSHEMLENDDMQQMLRVFSMGGTSNNLHDDSFAFPSYMPTPTPNYNFEVERGRSGKAVVGWLKIKAAMRWGIFIRKKAAERRRAQLVELEDST